MELTLLTGLIDALGKVAGGLKAIVNLPQGGARDDAQMLDETYRVIDTTLNMVATRLGDLPLLPADDGVLRGAARLDNCNKWMAVKGVPLCRSLRVALRKTETLVGKLIGASAPRTGTPYCDRCTPFLGTEGEVALFIGQQFQRSADERP